MRTTHRSTAVFKVEPTSRHWYAITLSSGCDEWPGCKLVLIGFGRYITIRLPRLFWPYREKVSARSWDAATVARLGRDWYWQVDERSFGWSCMDSHFSIDYGRQTHDSTTNKTWGFFLPWNEWRHVRHQFYGLTGEPCSVNVDRLAYEDLKPIKAAVPTVAFAFDDYDGERITATTLIEESEWLRGTKWCKWLSWFVAPKVARSLDIAFSAEVGPRKGSWKGGTVGHGIEMLPSELHEAAFRRYCETHKLKFQGRAP